MYFSHITEATQGLAQHILQHGEWREARGLKFLEVRNVSWEVANPMHRLLPLSPSRFPHPFQLLYETLWVLSGGSSIGVLSNYIPKAVDYSDDGKTWRGAYGPRIRKVLPGVLKALSRDQDTRQAYLPINWPEDTGASSKDIPCNLGLSFNRRGEYLDITRFCRSNDLLLGYSGINHFEFSVLLALVANSVGLKPGRFYNYVVSLHLYDNQIDRAKLIASRIGEDEVLTCSVPTGIGSTDVDISYWELHDIYQTRLGIDAAWVDGSDAHRYRASAKNFLALARLLLYAHMFYKRKSPETAAEWFLAALDLVGWTDIVLMSWLFLQRDARFAEVVSKNISSLPNIPDTWLRRDQ